MDVRLTSKPILRKTANNLEVKWKQIDHECFEQVVFMYNSHRSCLKKIVCQNKRWRLLFTKLINQKIERLCSTKNGKLSFERVEKKKNISESLGRLPYRKSITRNIDFRGVLILPVRDRPQLEAVFSTRAAPHHRLSYVLFSEFYFYRTEKSFIVFVFFILFSNSSVIYTWVFYTTLIRIVDRMIKTLYLENTKS